jgi:hypothetical protein
MMNFSSLGIKEREINKVSFLKKPKREKTKFFLQKNFFFSLFGFFKKDTLFISRS